MVLLVTVPLSLWGKFYFYIDAEGRYTKGPMYPLLLVLCYGHLLVIGIRALAGLLSKHSYARRMEYLAMGSFVVLPLVGGIAQAHYTGVSIICLAATVAAVQVFVNLQQTRITIDPLTQLNNRTRLIQHLDKILLVVAVVAVAFRDLGAHGLEGRLDDVVHLGDRDFRLIQVLRFFFHKFTDKIPLCP